MGSWSGAVRGFAWWDSNQDSIRQNEFDRIAAAETYAGEADTAQPAKCRPPNRFGFSSENTLNVLARASLFVAFRARLEFINASRHAFKTAKIVSSGLEQMGNLGTIHVCGRAVYK